MLEIKVKKKVLFCRMRGLTGVLISILILSVNLSAQSNKHYELDEIVVHAKKPMKDLGLEKTSFDSLALKENISLSIADVLTFNSSVFVKSSGRATLSTVAFRGTSPNHTQVTWNGMNINNPMLGMTDFSTIPAFFIDQASLLHGASSISETGGGLGGLIKLSNIPDVPEGYNLQYIQGIGSFSTFDEFVRFGFRNEKLITSTRVAYMSSPNDYSYINHDKKLNIYDEDHNIIGQYYPKEKNRSGSYKDLHLLQEIYYNFSKSNSFSFQAWYAYSNRELPLLTTDYGDPRQFENRSKNNTFRGILDWNHKSSTWKTDLKIGYSYGWSGYDYKREITDNNWSDITHARSVVNTIFGRGDWEYNPSNKWFFNVNINANQNFVTSKDKNIILQDGDKAVVGYNKGRIELSASATAKWHLLDRMGLSLVISEEFYGKKFTPIIPAFFVDAILTNNGKLSARASVASNFKFPSLNDLYFLPGGNPNLKSEKGITYDFSVSFKTAKSGVFALSANIGWFDSTIKDWIIWLPTPRGFFSPKNVRRVHSYGIELKGDIELWLPRGWGVNLSGAYSWTPSINKGEKISPADMSVGKQIPYVPKNSASLTGRLTWKSWSFLYKWCYYSKRFTMSSNDYSLSGILPDYFMNNIALSKDFIFNPLNIQLKLAINNLFNEDYLSVLSHPMPGINFEFYIGITPKFFNIKNKKIKNFEQNN